MAADLSASNSVGSDTSHLDLGICVERGWARGIGRESKDCGRCWGSDGQSTFASKTDLRTSSCAWNCRPARGTSAIPRLASVRRSGCPISQVPFFALSTSLYRSGRVSLREVSVAVSYGAACQYMLVDETWLRHLRNRSIRNLQHIPAFAFWPYRRRFITVLVAFHRVLDIHHGLVGQIIRFEA